MGLLALACSTCIEEEILYSCAQPRTTAELWNTRICMLVSWPCPLPLAKPARLLPISKPTHLGLRPPR